MIRKFYELARKIKNISVNGDSNQINLLITRLKNLYKKLSRIKTKFGVKLAAAGLAAILTTSVADAQNFKFQSYFKSNDTSAYQTGLVSLLNFADFDNDGDLDLTVGNYFRDIHYLEYDENNNFVFRDNIRDIENNPILSDEIPSFHTFGDIDNDGDLDLLLINGYTNLFLYENDGSNKFQFVDTLINNLGEVISVFIPLPDMVDIDDDSDLDLFIGDYYGQIHIFLNDGTGELTPNGLLQVDGSALNYGEFLFPKFSDLDQDGDFDLFCGNYDGNVLFFENEAGSFTNAGFLLMSDNSPIAIGDFIFPEFADYDDDGDIDLIFGEYYGYLYFYSNNGENKFVDEGLIEVINPPKIFSYKPAPTFYDIDNNGDMELYVGDYSGNVYIYEQNNNFDFGFVDTLNADGQLLTSGLVPTFFDINNDNVDDFFVANISGNVLQYAIDVDFDFTFIDSLRADGSVIDVSYFPYPAFVELGTERHLYIGSENVQIYNYDINELGNLSANGFLTSLEGVIEIRYAAPCFIDIDQDADIDIVIGDDDGYLNLFINNGSDEFTQNGFLLSNGEPIKVGYDARPAFADLDDDSDLDLIVGDYYGRMVFYRNDGFAEIPECDFNNNVLIFPNPTNGIFTITDTFGKDIEIFSIDGKLVYSEHNINTEFFTIDLSSLEKGVYIVKVKDNKKIKSGKIIIK